MSMFIFLLTLGALAGITSGKSIVEKTDDLFEAVGVNDQPMIGLLSQEISYYLDGKYPGQFNSYIAASYVKFIEGGGARVVPIW